MYREYLMASKLKIVLFLGTVRENRLGLRVAKFMVNELKKNNFEVDFFDPAELQFELLKKAVFHYKTPDECPSWLRECAEKVKAADAYMVVSGEYNHSIPPALSNMLDHFPGMYGGMRAAIQLRACLAELGCLSVSNIFGIPRVHQAIDEEGNPKDDHMVPGAATLIKQLEWHASAMKNHRDKFGLPAK